ncbi:7477_t:CDS:2 [Acaulospora morrowiae]|uniref:7477_t:CDS:1 n=1 Tax=Acaulospora morrowiae TaxID=94023 RepID=A0A9N9ARS2_9GLOM|nr:7477_t:CDS:2 [Acaulospora morrowiae]
MSFRFLRYRTSGFATNTTAIVNFSALNRNFSISMASQVDWTRFIRFIGEDGEIHQGQPIDTSGTWSDADVTKLSVKLISGDLFKGTAKVTNDVMRVKKLLAPLDSSQVPIIRCVGLNYKRHAKETNKQIPQHPILFIKPGTSLQGPFAPIKIPYIATDNQVDYEAELAVVIKKPCKNVSREAALDYVLGYTASNDVSARRWQGINKSSGQWCFSKGFDTFCPIGPVLVSPRIIGNPNALGIRARINGKMLQDSSTQDMIFDVPELISFLSRGTTLQPGSIILTGTPEGVGFVRKPPIFLQDGDEVSIEIDEIGTLTNTVEYEKANGHVKTSNL